MSDVGEQLRRRMESELSPPHRLFTEDEFEVAEILLDLPHLISESEFHCCQFSLSWGAKKRRTDNNSSSADGEGIPSEAALPLPLPRVNGTCLTPVPPAPIASSSESHENTKKKPLNSKRKAGDEKELFLSGPSGEAMLNNSVAVQKQLTQQPCRVVDSGSSTVAGFPISYTQTEAFVASASVNDKMRVDGNVNNMILPDYLNLSAEQVLGQLNKAMAAQARLRRKLIRRMKKPRLS